MKSSHERDLLISFLRTHEIQAVFHYQSLHRSPFYIGKHDGRELPHADRYSDCLVRLPLFFELTNEEIRYISEKIIQFYHQ